MAIKVSIVEDDAGIRASLAALIQRAPPLQLCGQYPDAETALEKIPGQLPEVILMDINLPGMNGVTCVQKLKADFPELQVLMLTVYEDSDSLFNSFKAGASGYLLKRTVGVRLVEAIQDVHAGGAPMTPQLARRVVQFFTAPQDSPFARLTVNELEFLGHLSHGYTYKEIADCMKLSLDSVRNYVRTVYEKLHVHSRTEAVVKFIRSEPGR